MYSKDENWVTEGFKISFCLQVKLEKIKSDPFNFIVFTFAYMQVYIQVYYTVKQPTVKYFRLITN